MNIDTEDTKVRNGYVLFWNGPFSNFDLVETGIIYKGERFPTSEHIFMWEKAAYFDDVATAAYILVHAKHPYEAKSAGRGVKGYDEAKWEAVRFNLMYDACYAKFTQSRYHKEQLLKYGACGKFVEASPYDGVWGIKLDIDHKHAASPKHWKGRNLLGLVLDRIYNEITMQGENYVRTESGA